MRKAWLITGGVLLLVLLLVACAAPAPTPTPTPTPTAPPTSTPTPTPTPAWKPPASIPLALGGTATPGYAMGVAMTTVIMEKTGVKFPAMPGDTAFERGVVLKDGRVMFAFMPSPAVLYGLVGEGDFAEWGKPQSFRIAYVADPNPMGVAVRATSKIYTMSDLKGMKVASYPTYPTMQLYIDGAMAYGNVTYKDVVNIPVSSFAKGMDAVLGGSADAAMFGGTAAQTQELKASVHGLRWIQFPNNTDEGKAAWARLQGVNPAFYPRSYTTTVPGSSNEKPVAMMCYDFQILTYDYTDADLVYWFTKQIYENYDSFKDRHARLKELSPQGAIDIIRWVAPYHDGSINYFKDKRVWTQAMEAKQKELLAKYPAKETR